MSESLFSPSWYRVASLRPRLRGHAQIHRHVYRGELWYVLQDHSTGRYHRFTPEAQLLIGLMDGERTVQQIWDRAATQLGDDAPTQDETIQILGQLHAADVLRCDVPPDTLELFTRAQQQERSAWTQRLASPLSQRFPLLDPEAFLEASLPLARPCFSVAGACLWLLVVVAAGVLAGLHWSELSDGAVDRALAPRNLLLIALIYPVVKALHELGHAYAAKIWGGEVHEMGIMLLVLMPIPYVDASSASAFAEKHRRIVVGAAGMLVEVFLAALALFVWINAEPGLVRDLAFDVMLIGGVSTLFFNGNPLLRFDGYYILADLLEIPNLAARSNRHIAYLFQSRLFAMEGVRSPANAPGEAGWFVFYGVASFVYRMLISFSIVIFLAGKFFTLGILLAAWAVTTQLLLPLWKLAAFVLADPRVGRRRLRAVTVSGIGVALILGVAVGLPVPLATRAEGVVWLPEKAQLRTGTDGFVKRLLVPPGQRVEAGEPILELEDPFLRAELGVLESKLREVVARYHAERQADVVQAEILKEEIATLEADLRDARERSERMVLRSTTAGVLVVPREQDLPDRYLRQGQLVGHVVELSDVKARVVVPQAQVGLVRQRTESVAVRLAGRLSQRLAAEVIREVPSATDRLPSRALGSSGGGAFAVDPLDEDGLRSLDRFFQFDLRLPEGSGLEQVGGRVFVRFDHGREPLARQGVRALRQLFLRKFGA